MITDLARIIFIAELIVIVKHIHTQRQNPQKCPIVEDV